MCFNNAIKLIITMAGNKQNQPEKTQGGRGDQPLDDPHHVRGDAKILERYGKHLEPTKRDAVLQKVIVTLLKEETGSARNIATLARVYATFDRINLDYLKFELEKLQREDTEESARNKAATLLKHIAAMKATVPTPDTDQSNDTDPNPPLDIAKPASVAGGLLGGLE